MAPPDLQAGGHRFDFISGVCLRCKILRKKFDDGGHPRCTGGPAERMRTTNDDPIGAV